MNSGLSSDVACRLHELIGFTKRVGNKAFNIGKILLIKIIDFVKAHPFLVTGICIGAVVEMAITTLITSIPFVGPLLAPVAAALGITIAVTGAVIGHNLNKRFSGIGEDIVEIAKSFFDLVAEVFNTIFRNVVTA